MITMRVVTYSLALLIAFAISAWAQTRIDSINTNLRWLGPDVTSLLTVRQLRLEVIADHDGHRLDQFEVIQ